MRIPVGEPLGHLDGKLLMSGPFKPLFFSSLDSAEKTFPVSFWKGKPGCQGSRAKGSRGWSGGTLASYDILTPLYRVWCVPCPPLLLALTRWR